MARPQFLQLLRHGKLLTAANFPQFVETFNYLVSRCENLKGDDDNEFGQGKITVDNADPEHPVIRFVGKMPSGGGGEVTVTGTDATEHTGSEFRFVSASNSNISVSVNPDTGAMTIGAYYV